jgi:GNAT superfamily N-acetyltransferase
VKTNRKSRRNESLNQWSDTLADGRRVLIRPIHPDDIASYAAFIDSLSPPSKHFVLLRGVLRLTGEALNNLCDPSHSHDMAYVALAGGDDAGQAPRQVGACRYAVTHTELGAEISVAVADDWQHCGLGGLLLRRLIDFARARGVKRIHSRDSTDNDGMRRLARRLGFIERLDPDDPHQVICVLDL